LFFIYFFIFISIFQFGCTSTTTNHTDKINTESSTAEQIIEYFMHEAPQNGNSIARYTNILNSGDKVTGYVELIGEWELAGDWATPWEFNAFDPNGEMLDHAILTYDLVDLDPHYYFTFVAPSQGEYTIEVIHISIFPRDLYMKIQPPGWIRSSD
jgi:hypothetical protein